MKLLEKIIYAVYLVGFTLLILKGILSIVGLFVITINAIGHFVFADKIYNEERNPKLSLFSYLFTYETFAKFTQWKFHI